MDASLRFLISGPGLIGKQHARLVSARPDCVLAVIVAPPTDENRAFATKFGAKFYTDVGQALQAESIDAAIISSPNVWHYRQALSCIEKTIPVLVEKPITDEIEDARKLADFADASKVPVLVGHHRTYSPLLDAASSFINSPRFGRLVAFQGAALFYKPEQYFKDGEWRTKKGGGPILINLIHEIGLMRHFCGEIRTVVAVASNKVRGFDVEDTVGITFEFESGAIGNFLLSDTAASNRSWEMTSGENPAYPHDRSGNCYHFAGTNGSLDFPTMKARYYATDAARSWWNDFEFEKIAFIPTDPLELQLQHFTEVVRSGVQPLVSARDGYRNMLVIEAIMRSIETRAVVELDGH